MPTTPATIPFASGTAGGLLGTAMIVQALLAIRTTNWTRLR